MATQQSWAVAGRLSAVPSSASASDSSRSGSRSGPGSAKPSGSGNGNGSGSGSGSGSGKRAAAFSDWDRSGSDTERGNVLPSFLVDVDIRFWLAINSGNPEATIDGGYLADDEQSTNDEENSSNEGWREKVVPAKRRLYRLPKRSRNGTRFLAKRVRIRLDNRLGEPFGAELVSVGESAGAAAAFQPQPAVHHHVLASPEAAASSREQIFSTSAGFASSTNPAPDASPTAFQQLIESFPLPPRAHPVPLSVLDLLLSHGSEQHKDSIPRSPTSPVSQMSDQNHPVRSRPKPRPAGEEDAGAKLSLGAWQDVEPLTLSETKLVLDAIMAKRRDSRKDPNETEVLSLTRDYLDNFARFKGKDNVEAVERLLTSHKELAKYERAQLGSLCCDNADEAKTLIPSLADKISDEALDEICAEIGKLMDGN